MKKNTTTNIPPSKPAAQQPASQNNVKKLQPPPQLNKGADIRKGVASNLPQVEQKQIIPQVQQSKQMVNPYMEVEEVKEDLSNDHSKLFQSITYSDDKLREIQQQNENLFQSFTKEFKDKYCKLFNKAETDSLMILHWRKLLSSVQSESNGFFNFSKFQNDFDLVYFNAPENQLFSDPQFPADQSVLMGKNGNYLFQRAGEINPQFDIFDPFKVISPEVILQGQLGDCYLISSISALAEFPDLCSRLFVQKSKNDKNVFGVWLFESGEWKQVVIDDYLVCSHSANPYPVFVKSVGNGIWVQLLEKAYAKVYGGYGKIEVGYSFDSLRDLSGSPTEYIDIKKNFGQAFEIVKASLTKNFILTASSKLSSADLQSKHSYTIFDTRELKNQKGQNVKLLKIKNPLGYNFEIGNGPDQFLEQKLGQQMRQGNGIIWMTEKEILDNFEVFTVCHTHPSFVNGSIQVQNKTTELLHLTNPIDNNHCYFSIVQKHEKFYKQGPNDNKSYYKTARIIVARIDPVTQQIVQIIGGNFGNKQQAFFEVSNLPKGEYLVFTEVDSKKAPQTNQFAFSTYSQHAVSIALASERVKLLTPLSALVQQFFIQYIAQINASPDWNTKIYDNTKGAGALVRDYSSVFGFAFISYRNQSETSFTEKVEIVESDNLELTNFDRTEKQSLKEIILQPGESRVIIYRILENNACSHALKFKGTWFFGNGMTKVLVPSSTKTLVSQNKVVAPVPSVKASTQQKVVSTQVKGNQQKAANSAASSNNIHAKSLSLKGMVDAYADL